MGANCKIEFGMPEVTYLGHGCNACLVVWGCKQLFCGTNGRISELIADDSPEAVEQFVNAAIERVNNKVVAKCTK